MLKRIRELLTSKRTPRRKDAAPAPTEEPEAPLPPAREPERRPIVHRGPAVVHNPIDESDLDPDAVKILKRLTRFEHTAYLVGGCVRDLLLGRRPKDFDIGTSATPRQVKRLFSNCRIIGRRFRLAHIKFGDKTIEVAMFRRNVPEGAAGRQALASGKGLQVSVQSAFGCGYEGVVPQERVLALVERFLEAGFTSISLADTAGHADPAQVEDLFGTIRGRAPHARLACHLHDTYGLGLANAYAALRAGASSFESAFGGLGGCPFTAVAAGNVCTEDLVHMLHRMNLRRDVKLEPLAGLARDAATFFGRELPGTVHRTGPIPHAGRFDSASDGGAKR